MGIFQNFQPLFHAPVGMNRVAGVHKAIHMDPAGQQDRQYCQDCTAENPAKGKSCQRGKSSQLSRTDHSPDQRQKAQTPAHTPVIPLCLGNRYARI